MNDLELRRQFDQWAEPLRKSEPPAVTEIHRRVRHRRAQLAAAAGSALAVTALAITVAAGLTAAAGRPGPATAPKPAHVAYPPPRHLSAQYLVRLDRYWQTAAVLNAAAGGKVIARITPTVQPAMFTVIAATPDDRLFVLGQQDGQARITFAELRISPAGRTQFGRVMPGVSLSGVQIYGISVSPDGSRLAFSTMTPGGSGPEHLLVYDLTNGALLGNFSEAAGIVTLQNWRSGYQLAVSWTAKSGSAGDGLRILNAATAIPAGTSLLADSVLDPAVHGYALGAFTADGSVALNVSQAGTTAQLQEYSTASGRLLHAVPIGPASELLAGANYCGVLWSSANGSSLVTQCGNVQLQVTNGHAERISLRLAIPAAQVGWADPFGW